MPCRALLSHALLFQHRAMSSVRVLSCGGPWLPLLCIVLVSQRAALHSECGAASGALLGKGAYRLPAGRLEYLLRHISIAEAPRIPDCHSSLSASNAVPLRSYVSCSAVQDGPLAVCPSLEFTWEGWTNRQELRTGPEPRLNSG